MYDLKYFVFSLLIIISTICVTLLVLNALEVLNMFLTPVTSNMPLHNSICNNGLKYFNEKWNSYQKQSSF